MDDVFDVRASTRYVPISPQKVRLVLDMVRGRDVTEALDLLQFSQKRASRTVAKLIKSAIANAEENFGLNREDLYIHHLTADKAPTRRWRRFGARGRFKPLLRRSSHINIILRERAFDQE